MNNGVTIAGLSDGAVPFGSGGNGTFSLDAGTFFWNNSSKRLGLGTSTPLSKLNVADPGGSSITITDTEADTNKHHWQLNNTGGTFKIRTTDDAGGNSSAKLVISNGGNIGIGTTSPYAKMSLRMDAAGGQTKAIAVDSQDGTPRFFVDDLGRVAVAATTTGDIQIAFTVGGPNGDAQHMAVPKGSLCVDSDGSCAPQVPGNIAAVSYSTGSVDLAENYSSTEGLDHGDIVMAVGGENVLIATKDDDSIGKIIGIVSTQPCITMGSSGSKEEGKYP
ncbi:MAG: hypothetical protein AAB276_04095, partial [Pseudomonadota bacterium]